MMCPAARWIICSAYAVHARMRSLRLILLLGLVSTFFHYAAVASGLSVLPQALITEPIDEQELVTLPGNTRPEVTTANDLGTVEDLLLLEHIYIQMARSAAQDQAAAGLLERLHDPGSPDYHRWLTANQVAAQFGPRSDDVAILVGWLERHGLSVDHVYAANGVIDVSGTARAVRQAFHTEIHRLSVNGEPHIANVSDPQIPAALAPAIVGIVALNDFRPHRALTPRASYDTGNSATPQILVPGDLSIIYDIRPLYAQSIAGQGQVIVVAEDSNLYSIDDWNAFRHTFSLDTEYPTGALHQIHPQPSDGSPGAGTCADPIINSDDIEATVDAEWASAAAPGATILVASCASTFANFGAFIAMENLLTGREPPPIVSISYGESESILGSGFNAYINRLYELGAFEGVSIFAAAGDWGAAVSDKDIEVAVSGINVNGFASTPHNVAVGGTDFADTYFNVNSSYWSASNRTDFSSALSYIPEIPWNDTCASEITAKSLGFAKTYGPNGSCNANGENLFAQFPDLTAGGGGPSGCATGNSAVPNPGVADGTCRGYRKPNYQRWLLRSPDDGVRDLPDVSLFASDGWWGHYYVVCFTDTSSTGIPSCRVAPSKWPGYGGTSFSAPIMAGVQAMVNQAAGARQGNPNYVYYFLAALQYNFGGIAFCNATLGNGIWPGCVFHDVTLGDTDVPCMPYGYINFKLQSFDCFFDGETVGLETVGVLSQSESTFEPAFAARPGYDLSTGLGSVDVYNLVRYWPGSRLRPCLQNNARC